MREIDRSNIAMVCIVCIGNGCTIIECFCVSILSGFVLICFSTVDRSMIDPCRDEWRAGAITLDIGRPGQHCAGCIPILCECTTILGPQEKIEQEETNYEKMWCIHCLPGPRYARLRRISCLEIFHTLSHRRTDSRCSDKPVRGKLSWCM